MLSALGAAVVSADELVHELLLTDAGVQREIAGRFGPGSIAPDGVPDRAFLAREVFGDSAKRRDLEGVLHPRVIARIAGWLRCEEERGSAVAVAEVPLLFEAGMQSMFDFTVVVTSEHATQAHRLKNSGLAPDDADARIRAQLPLASKEELAEFVLRNDGSLDDLRRRVRDLWDTLVQRSHGSRV